MRCVRVASLVLLLASVVVVPLARTDAPGVPPLPEQLRDTGLYSDWDARAVDAKNLPYAPQYPLWTDGAAKSRWLFLPEGSWIDASNPDAWEFPVGTKVWKEFRFNGTPAETRLIERTADGWRYASYAWRPDGSATLVPARGILNSVEIRDGIRHAIPSRTDCTACHEAGPSRLLSVSTLQLSSDRDPLAPHAEPLPDDGITLRTLIERRLVRNLPARLAATPPRIDASSPVARAALGYLHGNCGNCHGGASAEHGLDLWLRVGASDVASTPSFTTSVCTCSVWSATGPGGEVVDLRVAPGAPDLSVFIHRMRSRIATDMMPPMGTEHADEEGLRVLSEWIASLPEDANGCPHGCPFP